MRTLRIISFMLAAGLFVFGLLFVLASGQPDTPNEATSNFITGLVLVVISFVLVFLGVKVFKKKEPEQTNVTVKIDVPGKVDMAVVKCQSCGGTLAPENIKIAAGAPVVTCPYCHTTYTMTEQPKW